MDQLTRGELPEGVDQIIEASRAVDALLPGIAEQEAVVAQKRADLDGAIVVLERLKKEHEVAREQLRKLVAIGACTEANGCTHGKPAPKPKPLPKLPKTTATVAVVPDDPLGLPYVPIVWRIALLLLKNPVLDYQATAERLYGPTDPETAKNRVNGHLHNLKAKGVIKTLGFNRYEVNVERLEKLRGVLLEEVTPQG